MKLLLALVLLLTSISLFAAPKPTAVLLQDGRHAIVQNGQLLLVAPDKKQSPAPPGHYVTRDGKQFTVTGNGRISSDSAGPAHEGNATPVVSGSPGIPNAQSGAARPMSPLTPRPGSANPVVAGTPGIPNPPSGVVRPPSSLTPRTSATAPASGGQPKGDVWEAAPPLKNIDPILKVLQEITQRLEAMETKQALIEGEMGKMKTEILMAIQNNQVPPDILNYLQAINKVTESLPQPGWKEGDANPLQSEYWRILFGMVHTVWNKEMTPK
jgi:hypothetical protein